MKLRTLLLPLLLATPLAALAHTHLEKTVPANRSRVEVVHKLELHFTDTVQLTALSIRRNNEEAMPLALPALSASQFTIPVQTLAAGEYVVSWTAESDDTHLSTGKFTFTVGAATPQPR